MLKPLEPIHIGLAVLLFLAIGCKSTSSTNQNVPASSLEKTLDSTGKTLNELIREEKKRQAELDLPFRGLDPHKDLNTIAFGSCADQDKPQPLWKNILAQQPDLFLYTGDNIYASRKEQRPIREQYKKLNRIQEYRDIREKVPFLATWDDHDFGQNDGGSDNPDKTEARQEFLRYWTYLRHSLPKEQKALYHSRLIGKKKNIVQVIMLDTRWDRSPLKKYETTAAESTSPLAASIDTTAASTDTQVATAVAASIDATTQQALAGIPEEFLKTAPAKIYQPDNDKQKRMLSEEQWRWLESELRKPASLRIIVSSVQVIAQDHTFEKWGNFPHERDRLFNLLKSTKARNVIFVSGDRHMGSVAKTDIKGVGTVYDVTASAINRPARPGNQLLDPTYIKPGFPNENFGLIKINWADKSYAIELLDINNQVISSATGKF